MRTVVLLLALCFATTAAHADKVYKWVDAQGSVLYTDQPLKGAQEMKIAKQPPSALATAAAIQDNRTRYTTVNLTSPTREETIRDNEGNVTVAVDVVPPLRTDLGDRLRLSLDGAAPGPAMESGDIVLPAMDQGTHTLQAVVTDRNGRVLARSDAVEFYLKHWSVFNPTGPGNYPATYPPQPYPSVYPKQVYTPVYPPQGTTKPRK